MQIPIKQIVLAIIIFGILVNLGPFGSIGHRAQHPGYQSILQLADTGIIAAEGITHRRGLYIALGEFAPRADILIPDNNNLDVAQIYGLGRARSVTTINYDSKALGKDIVLSDHIVTRFMGNKRLGPGPFVIALKTKSPDTIVFLKRNGTWYLVDSDLLHLETF